MKQFIEDYFKPICVAIVALLGVATAWLSVRDKIAPAKAPIVDASAGVSLFDQDVMKKVNDAITAGDLKQYPRLALMVAKLDNAALAVKLTQLLADAGSVEAKANASAMAAFASTNVADGRAAIPAASPSNASGPVSAAVARLDVTRIVPRAADATRTIASIAGGWNVDVFWCQGGDDGARRGRADAFAAALAAAGPGRLAGQTLGRLRVRPLPFIVNQRAGYQLHADAVRAEASASERAVAAALVALAAASGQPLGLMTSSQPTPNYLSAFYCA